MTWSPAQNPHILAQETVVAPDATLTIQPGTVVRFLSNASITVKGKLVAKATPGNRIVFTSYNDPEYGGSGSSKSPGYWNEIRVFNDMAPSSAVFEHCLIRNGGDVSAYGSSSLFVRSCRVENAREVGLGLYGLEGEVLDSTISGCGAQGVMVLHGAPTYSLSPRRAVIRRNVFTGNGGPAIHAYTYAYGFDCAENTGSSNQKNGIVLQCGFESDAILGPNPGLPYVIVSSRFTETQTGICPCGTLTILPGAILKFADGIDVGVLYVKGNLKAIGTPTQRIIFTSIRDDVGGDTNGDGFSTSPVPGDWQGIRIGHPARTGVEMADGTAVLQHCVVRYGGAKGIANLHVVTPGSSLTVQSSDITDGAFAGIFGGGSASVRVNNSIIQRNQPYGVRQTGPNYVDARLCFWGHGSGPRDVSDDRAKGGDYNPSGQGDAVTDFVRYRSFFAAPGYGVPGGISPSDGRGGSDVTQITASDPLIIRVTDPDANLDPTKVETITVIVTTSRGDREVVVLTETGPNTGIFEGRIDTIWGQPNPGDDKLQVQGGDLIMITYHDLHDVDGGERDITQTISVKSGHTAVLTVPGAIVAGETVPVTLTDADLDETPGAGNDSLTITVPTSGGDHRSVTLNETGDRGEFKGEIPTAFALTPVAGDATLQVKGRDTLTVSYTDALDETGKPNVLLSQTVTVAAGTDAQITAPTQVTSTGGVTLTVIDPDRDVSGETDTITVPVKDTTTGETEELVLSETEVKSGVFTGTLPTAFGTEPGTPGDGTLTLKGRDEVSISFTDTLTSSGQPNVVTSQTAQVAAGTDGSASVSLEPIVAGDSVKVTITDRDAANHGPLTVTATSPTGDTATIELPEIETGLFIGYVPTGFGETPNTQDGIIQVLGGQKVTITYVDAIDDAGRTQVPHVSEVAVRAGHTAALTSSVPAIIAGQSVEITLVDDDLAGQGALTLDVKTTGFDRCSFTVQEGSTPGTFKGTIATEFSGTITLDDPFMQVKGGETITVTYRDVLDTDGRRDQDAKVTILVKQGTDGSISIPTIIKSTDGLTVTVTDPDMNLDEGKPDTVTLAVTNPTRGDAATLLLTETGDATDVFSGRLATAFGETAETSNDTLEVKGGDTVKVVYTDVISATGEPNLTRTAEVTVQTGAVSKVELGLTQIRPGETFPITITDPDRNLEPLVPDTITVTARTSAGDELTIILTETGPNTGIFSGDITTVFSETVDTSDTKLQVKGGDTITLTYTDPLDAEGRVDHPVTGSVAVRGGTNGKIEIGTTSIPAGATLILRVIDPDLDGAGAPVIDLRTSGGDLAQATLTAEAGAPGTFTARIPTERSDTPSTTDATLQVLGGQTITVRYTDALDELGRHDQVQEREISVRSGTTGGLQASASIRPGDALELTVSDVDRDLDTAAPDTLTVAVTDPSTGEVESATLTETGDATGTFTGTLPTAYGKSAGAASDGRLSVKPGDTLSTTYDDVAESGAQETRTASTSVTGNTIDHDFTAGRHLIAIPAQLFGPSVSDVLGIDGAVRKLAAYDPATGYDIYESGGTNPLSGLFRPGAGYFALLNDAAFNQMREYGTLLPQDQPGRILLKRGWNLIGSPFLADSGWNRDLVKVRYNGLERTIRQAATENAVVDYLWGLEDGRYKLVADLDMNLPGSSRILRAWNGYWLFSLVEGELVLPLPSSSGASIQSVRRTTESEGDWAFQITAQRGTQKDGVVVGSRGAAGAAAIQVQKPPALPGEAGAVSVSLVGEGAATGAGLAYDVRTAAVGATAASYRLRVDATPSDEWVVLAWSDLGDVPAGMRLILVDEATGERRYMRTTSTVQIQSEDGKPRFFRVVVEPAGEGLRIMGLNPSPARGGGVAVTYSLSTSAQVEMTVLSLNGKPIRRLPQGGVSTQGLNNTTWDGRDSAGRSVPSGTYLIELTARTDIGEVAKTAVPVVVK